MRGRSVITAIAIAIAMGSAACGGGATGDEPDAARPGDAGSAAVLDAGGGARADLARPADAATVADAAAARPPDDLSLGPTSDAGGCRAGQVADPATGA